MKIYNTLFLILAYNQLAACSKETAYESMKAMDQIHDRSITEPELRENESYRDYQKNREEVLKDKK